MPPGHCGRKRQLITMTRRWAKYAARWGRTTSASTAISATPRPPRRSSGTGIYHSGDLGHIRVIDGKRYLYFNGRTDDWIRKDGENFSAENVLHYAQEMPGVDCAIAYGAPCDVSDENVMVTVQLKKS